MSGNFLPLRGFDLYMANALQISFHFKPILNSSVPLIFCSGYAFDPWHSFDYYSKKTPRPVP